MSLRDYWGKSFIHLHIPRMYSQPPIVGIQSIFLYKYINQSSPVFPNFFHIIEYTGKDHFVWHSWVNGAGYLKQKVTGPKTLASLGVVLLPWVAAQGMEAKCTELRSTGRCQSQLPWKKMSYQSLQHVNVSRVGARMKEEYKATRKSE